MTIHPDTQTIIRAAREIAFEQGTDTLGTQHLIYAISAFEHDPVGQALRSIMQLGKMGADIPPEVDPREVPITLSHATGEVINEASALAKAARKPVPSSIHYVIAILNSQKTDNVGKYVLESHGFTLERLIDHMNSPQS